MTHGAFILGPEGSGITEWERGFFREADPWGFILFARNVDTHDQLRRLTGSLRDAVGREALILIDQEGGRVQRLRPPHWQEWLPPFDQAGQARDAVRSFWLRYRLIAAELRAVGIDGNCAPTCDIASQSTHPFLRNRCLGETPDTVTALARASADGMLAGGVLPVIKHMPGHGRGMVDSHLNLPVADVPASEARRWDFAPFRGLCDLPLGMSAHIVYPDFDSAPATQSRVMVDLIRRDIGFDGLLMTDDISMEALSDSLAERARLSLAAGCDVVLHCNGKAAEMQTIAEASGRLSAAALARAGAALTLRRDPEPADLAEMARELTALLA